MQMSGRGTNVSFFRHIRRFIDKVFATVENDERWLSPATDRSGPGTTLSVCTETPSAARPLLEHERRAAERTQVDKIDLAIESGAHLMCDRHRYRGLAYPPGPTTVTKFCSASFIWIAASAPLRRASAPGAQAVATSKMDGDPRTPARKVCYRCDASRIPVRARS